MISFLTVGVKVQSNVEFFEISRNIFLNFRIGQPDQPIFDYPQFCKKNRIQSNKSRLRIQKSCTFVD